MPPYRRRHTRRPARAPPRTRLTPAPASALYDTLNRAAQRRLPCPHRLAPQP